MQIPNVDTSKQYHSHDGFGTWVTNDVFSWTNQLVASTASILQLIPEQSQIVLYDQTPTELLSGNLLQQRFYFNIELRMLTFPFSGFQVEGPVPLETVGTWREGLKKTPSEYLRYHVDMDVAPLFQSLPTDVKAGQNTPHVYPIPSWPHLLYGLDGIRNFTDYFSRIKMYIILHHKDLRYPKLRTLFTRLSLNLDTFAPTAKVVDSFFYENVESTNRSKVSRLVVWYDFLDKHLSLYTPQWSQLNLRAWKAASIFVLLERGSFRNYFLLLFLQTSPRQMKTDELYLSGIVEINSALRMYELTTQILVAPKSTTSKIVRKKLRLFQPRSQTSTPIPIMIWFDFIVDLFYAPTRIQQVLAIFALINFLTVSRFNEVLSFQMSQLQPTTEQISFSKTIRILPINMHKSKVGPQTYAIPILLEADMLNLEILLQLLEPHLKPAHLSLRELQLPNFPRMNNALFNKLLAKAWKTFLAKPTVSFDPRDTHFTSHSLRKLSAEFYVNVLKLDVHYVRILFGHSIKSRVLERDYLQKTRFQLTQETYWKLATSKKN